MRQNGRRTSLNDPLAYFLTFRCYGTWLPGDRRGWMDRSSLPLGEPLRSRHPGLHAQAAGEMTGTPFKLESAHRQVVDAAIRDVCAYREWRLHALNVRTNHVHLVVSAGVAPEQAMTTLKAWATRRLRQAGLVVEGAKPWSRHGSTRYLWRVDEIEATVRYVLEEQGSDLA